MAIRHSGSGFRRGATAHGVNVPRQQGFTLIEMLIALSVLAVFSMITIPAYQKMMARQVLDDLSNTLLTSLLYARNQASTHNLSVKVCPRGSDHACGQHWKEGWQIMMADGDKGVRIIDTSDIDAGLISEDYGSGNKSEAIMFNSMGYLSSSVSGFQLSHQGDVRYVCISMSGQASVRSHACGL
ncbi:GspH/FimT family pseudopilin [Kushneria indalinina]|uniref:Type II secretion system protein H n=1 Tax=Kushneria indalinina DSM 14324 TaxID=1122140 RepID=A0A3D9DVX5_9GAMM|nr:GspH/FimT family pseudopilin [Kushneria indalinina]REC94930.1 prepilin-type N-terminal cleavage/methylation domain-containing protein [Kushneria indalinina DSM 14324]